MFLKLCSMIIFFCRVAVSRALRSVNSDCERPQDWYSTKNCALQYGELLEGVAPAKRKRDKERSSTSDAEQTNETTVEVLTRILTKSQYLSQILLKFRL